MDFHKLCWVWHSGTAALLFFQAATFCSLRLFWKSFHFRSYTKPKWFRIYMIPKQNDSDLIWFQNKMIPTLYDSIIKSFRLYMIPNQNWLGIVLIFFHFKKNSFTCKKYPCSHFQINCFFIFIYRRL